MRPSPRRASGARIAGPVPPPKSGNSSQKTAPSGHSAGSPASAILLPKPGENRDRRTHPQKFGEPHESQNQRQSRIRSRQHQHPRQVSAHPPRTASGKTTKAASSGLFRFRPIRASAPVAIRLPPKQNSAPRCYKTPDQRSGRSVSAAYSAPVEFRWAGVRRIQDPQGEEVRPTGLGFVAPAHPRYKREVLFEPIDQERSHNPPRPSCARRADHLRRFHPPGFRRPVLPE
jgi:hypothetical protein